MMKAYGFQTCKRQDEQFTEEVNFQNYLFNFLFFKCKCYL